VSTTWWEIKSMKKTIQKMRLKKKILKKIMMEVIYPTIIQYEKDELCEMFEANNPKRKDWCDYVRHFYAFRSLIDPSYSIPIISEEMLGIQSGLFSARLVQELEWTQNELQSLPKDITCYPIHVALKIADSNNDMHLVDQILDGDGPDRKNMLLQHIKITSSGIYSSIFGEWNYLKND
jgi:hypothetical protein